MKNKIAAYLLAILVLGLAVYGLRDIFLKYLIENMLKSNLGLNIRIAEVHSNLMSGKVKMLGVVAENPEGFNRKLLVYIPNITAYILPGKLLKRGRLHLRLLDFELEKVNVIRDKNDQVNLKLISGGIREKSKTGHSQSIQIDFIRFDIKDVFFYDEKDLEARVRPYTIDQYGVTYKNAQKFGDIVDAVINEVVAEAKLHETLNYLTSSLIKKIKRIPSKTLNAIVKPSEGVVSFFSGAEAQETNPSKTAQNVF